MIAGRLVWLSRRVKTYRTNGLSHWDVVETLVQSAAVYSATLASLLGTYLAGSNAQYICLDLLTPIIVSSVVISIAPPLESSLGGALHRAWCSH